MKPQPHFAIATPAAPIPAPAVFPYDHATVEQTDSSAPVAWRLANAARFDRLYGAHGERSATARNNVAVRKAAARAWHLANKPYFDALYGP